MATRHPGYGGPGRRPGRGGPSGHPGRTGTQSGGPPHGANYPHEEYPGYSQQHHHPAGHFAARPNGHFLHDARYEHRHHGLNSAEHASYPYAPPPGPAAQFRPYLQHAPRHQVIPGYPRRHGPQQNWTDRPHQGSSAQQHAPSLNVGNVVPGQGMHVYHNQFQGDALPVAGHVPIGAPPPPPDSPQSVQSSTPGGAFDRPSVLHLDHGLSHQALAAFIKIAVHAHNVLDARGLRRALAELGIEAGLDADLDGAYVLEDGALISSADFNQEVLRILAATVFLRARAPGASALSVEGLANALRMLGIVVGYRETFRIMQWGDLDQDYTICFREFYEVVCAVSRRHHLTTDCMLLAFEDVDAVARLRGVPRNPSADSLSSMVTREDSDVAAGRQSRAPRVLHCQEGNDVTECVERMISLLIAADDNPTDSE